jgi:hypothetical protein
VTDLKIKMFYIKIQFPAHLRKSAALAILGHACPVEEE